MLSILGLGWHGPSVQLESGESGLYPRALLKLLSPTARNFA